MSSRKCQYRAGCPVYQAINKANHFQINVFSRQLQFIIYNYGTTTFPPTTTLALFLPLLHTVSNTLGLDFIVAVTKPAQSPTIVEKEMTAIRINKNE